MKTGKETEQRSPRQVERVSSGLRNSRVAGCSSQRRYSTPLDVIFDYRIVIFCRMEETVRSMLLYKKQAEQLRQEKNALTLAFEVSLI